MAGGGRESGWNSVVDRRSALARGPVVAHVCADLGARLSASALWLRPDAIVVGAAQPQQMHSPTMMLACVDGMSTECQKILNDINAKSGILSTHGRLQCASVAFIVHLTASPRGR